LARARRHNATSYAQTSGFVFDADPRLISNLIVDMTDHNPAAVAAAASNGGAAGAAALVPSPGSVVKTPGLDGLFGTATTGTSSSSRT